MNHAQPSNGGAIKLNYRRQGCNPGCNMDNSISWPASGSHSGGVKFIKDTIALRIWYALGTRAGGEVINADND